MPFFGTIKELLSIQNPRLDTSLQTPGKVTKDPLYQPIKAQNISHWDDFTYANIEAAYGHLFHLGPYQSYAYNLRGTPSRIERETHVDQVASMWCMQMCRLPIKEGAAALQVALGVDVLEATMQPQGMTCRDRANKETIRIPDWTIYLHKKEDETQKRKKDNPRIALVWGDDKCSSKWNSDPETCERANWIWPFRQMLTYCVNNNTRYSCILTPEELVVLRVYRTGNSNARVWAMQYKSIPWNAYGNELTVNFGLWAIAMMSVNEGYRAIYSSDWTLPLNVWWKDKDKTGATSYVHHLSGHSVSVKPKGGDVRSRPTTIPRAELDELDVQSRKRRRTTQPSSSKSKRR